jgi:hypothetical protein
MNPADWDPLLAKYRRKGLLLDTNLLLLLIFGRFAPKAITEFKLLTNQAFTVADFELLKALVSIFSTVITTPHILTEISNQCGLYHGRSRADLMAGVSLLVQQFNEQYLESKDVVRRNDFAAFGLTDSAITAIAPGKFLVLTKDSKLVAHLQKNKIDAINFTHLRDIAQGM